MSRGRRTARSTLFLGAEALVGLGAGLDKSLHLDCMMGAPPPAADVDVVKDLRTRQMRLIPTRAGFAGRIWTASTWTWH